MLCPACQTENDADALFCKHCSTSLADGTSTSPTSITSGGDNYSITIDDPGPNKIALIKAVRETMMAGLKEAKFAVEQDSGAIHTGLSQQMAEQIAQKLRESGATVSVVRGAGGLTPGKPLQVKVQTSYKLNVGSGSGSSTKTLFSIGSTKQGAAFGPDAPTNTQPPTAYDLSDPSQQRSTGLGPLVRFLIAFGLAVLGYLLFMKLKH